MNHHILAEVPEKLAVMAAHTCAFGAEISMSGSDLGVSSSISLPASVAGESQPCLAFLMMPLRTAFGAVAVVEATTLLEDESAEVASFPLIEETRADIWV